jgi:hypothetical protein
LIHLRFQLLTAVLTAVAVAQTGVSRDSTSPEVAEAIARVKNVPASNLQKGLPTTRFEDWVKGTAGPDTQLDWSFNRGATGPTFQLPDLITVHAVTKNRQEFWLTIASQTSADRVVLFWHEGLIVTKQKSVAVEHLNQLPGFLHRTSQSVKSSGVQK